MPVEVVGALARAKLNLYLHVLGRREDGYHVLDGLVAFAEIGDRLEARASDDLALRVVGPFAAALEHERDNLILRAARELRRLTGATRGASIELDKHLPVAAGIGGGSADAAAALEILARLWKIEIDEAQLATIALALGADVPVCRFARAAFVGGIGEAIDAAPALPQAGLVLVNPGIPLPTAHVFKRFAGPFGAPARFSTAPGDARDLAERLRARENQLTPAAMACVPAIGDVLASIAASPGCLLARMSGSGATCFGLYDDRRAAALAARWLAGRLGNAWVAPSVLVG